MRLRPRMERCSPLWLETLIADACSGLGEYGLLLPAVTHRGDQLPIASILRRLRAESPPRLAVVDGAQALGNVPVRFNEVGADIFLAGCHKWLGGHNPLAVAVCRDESVVASAAQMVRHRRVEDPLMSLCLESEVGCHLRHGETACLAPLFSAQGAVDDALAGDARQRLAGRLVNRRRVLRVCRQYGWREQAPERFACSGILLVRPAVGRRRRAAASLRSRLASLGVLATVYASGSIRLAMPSHPLTHTCLQRIAAALVGAARDNPPPRPALDSAANAAR